ncbi:class I SAM-dependent methyltransferase [Robiginitomaculum antarcticum]|uniref:class I SAM-dependent methyltransferase n=1 Tax=Robiginitomaculum antarcticum TaxID=437507 RepID=UPI00037556AB|nr:SAM-dependent methyltransferase [Robiginitomaculum antarcticum]
MSRLKARLLARIDREGPMNIAAYMTACLFDPVDGFYPTRDPLGSEGDFITAPEVSQMFGELLGIFAVQSWRDMGRPETLHLIELGPGRGVMMSDMIRAARIDPDFLKAMRVTLVEASPALEAVQGQTLVRCPYPVSWVHSLTDVPAGPSLIVANEFLDCLPIRQFIRHRNRWHERMVMRDPDGADALVFGRSSAPEAGLDLSAFDGANEGDLVEYNPGLTQLCAQFSDRFARHKGRALLIDYGPAVSEVGDTLQAIAKHKKVDPLDAPGQADLTARVDFAALTRAATEEQLSAFGPYKQAEFLTAMGIDLRAAKLARQSPDQKPVIERQLRRLMDGGQMGALFKVMILQSKSLPDPIGISP